MYTLVCPCLFGLESVLKSEIMRIGGQNIQTIDGRVSFKGDDKILARANICLGSAERVLIEIGSYHAETFPQLFDGACALPIEDYIGVKDSFPVTGWSISSNLKSISDCQSIIKKALVKRMSSVHKLDWFEETGPTHQVRFSILRNHVSIYLDTTGIPLHKRGYRPQTSLAPIKETLAAGIADFARVKSDSTVIDPMCGSGTLLIEAAYKAMNIAPGLKRKFISEDWGLVSPKIWEQERQNAYDAIKKDSGFCAVGYDIDNESIILASQNAERASVAGNMKVSLGALENFKTPKEPFILITNPPYGERMSDREGAEKIIRLMGKKFAEKDGAAYYIISPHNDFERLFGRTARRRRKLNNGDIRCQLYMYF